MRRSIFVCGLIFAVLIFSVSSNSLFEELGNSTNDDHEVESARKKKRGGNKYMMPLLLGAVLVKSIIFPLAFKAMAVMSGLSVLLSTMSLIVTSMVAFAKLGSKPNPIKVVHKIPYNSWAKDDNVKNFYGNVDNTNYDMVPPAPQ